VNTSQSSFSIQNVIQIFFKLDGEFFFRRVKFHHLTEVTLKKESHGIFPHHTAQHLSKELYRDGQKNVDEN
jgi:hypothetical protein